TAEHKCAYSCTSVVNSVAGERPFRSPMCPPVDVPSAPSRSSTDSTEMPRSRIAPFNAAVLAPGSPDASPGSGNGSPSVCSTSYLGISQPGHGNAHGGGRGRHVHPKGRVEEYALHWS